MIKVTLLIDNKTAHSCSPIKFVEKFILQEAKEIPSAFSAKFLAYDTPYAKILINEIKQD